MTPAPAPIAPKVSASHQPLVPVKNTQVLAFHLPQFHPIAENDEWWGRGFTEWTNVTRGRPLFQGHQQPHLPADLGFYDLRLPEVRERQAALAREAGISGFVYHHYWFNGRRLLERPVEEILRSNQPDFPFCFNWANEPWTRNWDGKSSQVLMPQVYSDEDDLAHIRWLLEAFADERYIKIDGRPLLLIYRPSHLPDMRRTAALWRREAQARGFPDLYLCAVRAFVEEFRDARAYGLDASVEFKPNGTDCGQPLKGDNALDVGYRLHRVWDYDQMVDYARNSPLPDYPFFPGICPSWDNSVRRKSGGMIFREATPQKYEAWLREILMRENLRPQTESLVFVNAWNEWAEGNHLEPCQRWGHGYLHATREAVEDAQRNRAGLAEFTRGQVVSLNLDYRILGNRDHCEWDVGTVAANGWCLDLDTLAPPDVLAYAVKQRDGDFHLLAPVEHQRMPRPDVLKEHRVAQSLQSGWKGRLQLDRAGFQAIDVYVLALRLADGAAAELTCLG